MNMNILSKQLHAQAKKTPQGLSDHGFINTTNILQGYKRRTNIFEYRLPLNMENSNNLKWMCFSGLAQDYASWSTRFTAFLQTKSLFDTLMGMETVPQRPERLGENPNDEDRNRHARETQAYTDKLNDIEQRNNTVWCYLAMTLDSTSLMLLRHDCVNLRGNYKQTFTFT